MNIQAPENMLSNALREVAMLAEFRSSSLGLTRTDKNASSRAETDHQAVHGAARVSVSRLAGADGLHREIVRCQNDMRACLQSFTTTWSGTRRLLPNANFEKWIAEHYQLDIHFKTLLGQMTDQAADIVEQARQNIGSFAVAPPSVEELTSSYEVGYTLEPIPDGAQFSTDNPALESYLKEQFEHNIKLAYGEAQQDALSRLAKPMEAIVERMIAYEERAKAVEAGGDPGKTGFFRDTLVTNASEIAAVFKSFNLMGDDHLNGIASKLDLFMNVKPDDLRKSPELRAAVSQRAREVLDSVNDMLIPVTPGRV